MGNVWGMYRAGTAKSKKPPRASPIKIVEPGGGAEPAVADCRNDERAIKIFIEIFRDF